MMLLYIDTVTLTEVLLQLLLVQSPVLAMGRECITVLVIVAIMMVFVVPGLREWAMARGMRKLGQHYDQFID